MKDWIEILIGVVVFGVLIAVHLLDHILAVRRYLQGKPQDDAPLSNLDEPADVIVLREAPVEVRPAPQPVKPLVAKPAAMRREASVSREEMSRKDVGRTRPLPREDLDAPPTALPTVQRAPKSPLAAVMHTIIRDPKLLAGAFLLREVLGPPLARRQRLAGGSEAPESQ